MSNHNYSQYSSNKKKKNYNKLKEETFVQVDVAENEIVPDVVTTVAVPVEPVEVKMEAPKAEVKAPVTGIVAGCSKLNVRSKPAIDADILAVLEVNSEVVIDPTRSTNEWVKVTTAAGVEGYCMRKFVSAKA